MSRNRGHVYGERAGREAHGVPVLEWLARTYAHSSREEWRRRIEEGLVTIDGAPTGPDALLRYGQVLSWSRPPWEEPDAPRTFAVLHRDDHLLAVAKPAGLPTLPGGGYLEGTLLSLVRTLHPEAAPLHRLGRWTSGVVLFARTAGAAAALTRGWRDVRKVYRALATGTPERAAFDVDIPIGPVPHRTLGTVHAASAEGKRSQSRVHVLERRPGAFLAEVAITTGRPHQIRIHLAAAGHPLVGDPLYAAGGLPIAGTTALPGDPGYLLHARELGFRHPVRGTETVVMCEPPGPLRLLVRR